MAWRTQENPILEVAPVPEERQRARGAQKNGPVVRPLLGKGCLDRLGLERELSRLCEDHSDFRNFCVPCKMPVAKTKRLDGKGFTCRHDRSTTPCVRVLAGPAVPENVKEAFRRRKAKINGIELYHRIMKRLRRVWRVIPPPPPRRPDLGAMRRHPFGDGLRQWWCVCGGGGGTASRARHSPPSRKCPAFDEHDEDINHQNLVLFLFVLAPAPCGCKCIQVWRSLFCREVFSQTKCDLPPREKVMACRPASIPHGIPPSFRNK